MVAKEPKLRGSSSEKNKNNNNKFLKKRGKKKPKVSCALFLLKRYKLLDLNIKITEVISKNTINLFLLQTSFSKEEQEAINTIDGSP